MCVPADHGCAHLVGRLTTRLRQGFGGQARRFYRSVSKPPAMPFRRSFWPSMQLHRKSRGCAPGRRLTLFACPKRVSRERAPRSLPFGYPARSGHFEGGQKLASLKHLPTLFSKWPLRSGCVTGEGAKQGRLARVGERGWERNTTGRSTLVIRNAGKALPRSRGAATKQSPGSRRGRSKVSPKMGERNAPGRERHFCLLLLPFGQK